MAENQDFNQHPAFDNNVNSSLGLYVYALFDPRDRTPFYVGKGGGKHGNDRVLHHFSEARHDRNRGNQSKSAPDDLSKVRKIQEIWDSGNEVDWKIVRRHLSNEKEALSVEAALIDAFTACGYKLLNAQGGHGGEKHGLIEGSRLYEYAAPLIAGQDFPTELINRPLFIFNISRTVDKMWDGVDRVENPNFKPDYEQATTCCWKVGPHWRALSEGVAIGVVGGISRAVFAISDWERCQSDPKLWQIIPADIGNDTSAAVLNRNFSSFLEPVKGYLQRGGFVICEVSETGDRMFRRGAKNRYPDSAPSGSPSTSRWLSRFRKSDFYTSATVRFVPHCRPLANNNVAKWIERLLRGSCNAVFGHLANVGSGLGAAIQRVAQRPARPRSACCAAASPV